MGFLFKLMGFLFKLMGFLFELMGFLFRLMGFLFGGGRRWGEVVAQLGGLVGSLLGGCCVLCVVGRGQKQVVADGVAGLC